MSLGKTLLYVTLRISDFGHSKLGATKSTLPETFAGLPIDAITQSGFEFDPVNE